MARGQSQAASENLAMTNKVGAGYNTQAENLQSKLIPAYTSLMNTGYLSPEEEAAATTNEMGAATAPFETAKFEAANRAAATRNPADLAAQQDQLAREEGQTAGRAAGNLQAEKMQNQLAGAGGLANLSAEDLRAMESLYGLGPGTLEARAAGKSGDELAMGWVNTALSAAGGH